MASIQNELDLGDWVSELARLRNTSWFGKALVGEFVWAFIGKAAGTLVVEIALMFEGRFFETALRGVAFRAGR